MAELTRVEYLYAIEAEGYDGNDDWHPARVIQFQITRKTPKRIYYRTRDGWPERFVDRLALERDGQAVRRTAGWWEPDLRVYLQPPVVEQAQKPTVAELKAAMAEAHPDRGGSDEAFIAARRRYEAARDRVPRP